MVLISFEVKPEYFGYFLIIILTVLFIYRQTTKSNESNDDKSELNGNKMIPLHVKTPVIYSNWLSNKIGTNIHLKMDSLQPTGSFKIRGIGNICQQIIYNDYNNTSNTPISHFISSSGANAGMAVAYSAQQLNVRCSIVLSKNDKHNMLIPKFKELNANVIFHGNNWNDADKYAREYCQNNDDSSYIEMFDDENIFRGHSTIISELYSHNNIKPDCIVVSCGGGGLLSGIALGLLQLGWQHSCTIIAAQSENCKLFYDGVQNNGKSILSKVVACDGHDLGYRQICEKAMFWHERFKFFENEIVSVIVKDEDVLNMCQLFADNHHTLVEPLCAVGLTAVYTRKDIFDKFSNVVVVVCGGNLVSIKDVYHWNKNDKMVNNMTDILSSDDGE